MKEMIEVKLQELAKLIMDYEGLVVTEDMSDIYITDTFKTSTMEIQDDVLTVRIQLTK